MKQFRRRFVTRLLLTVVAATSFSFWAPAAEPPGKTVRLLNVGNSFSNNAVKYLSDLVKADGKNRLILDRAVIGGSSPDKHLEKVMFNEMDPKDRFGLYATGKSLKDYLTAEPWDFITVQQASIKSHDVATYRPHMANLVAYIKKHAPQAEVIVHQTWAYRVDDPRFGVAEPKEGEPRTQREMYDGLTRAYNEIAAELNLRVVPVGDAFYAADTDRDWGYRVDPTFDPAKPKVGELPDQTHSLHVGRRWSIKDGKPTLGMDGHHANSAGEYLGGCVFYEFLFGDVVGNKFVAPGVDKKYARFLQETARDAVAKRRS
jgi:hypothetical protein